MVLQIKSQRRRFGDLVRRPCVLEQYVSWLVNPVRIQGIQRQWKQLAGARGFINQDWLLVDEVQSDLVNSVTQRNGLPHGFAHARLS
jgi:hypothetical protein